ncbi:MAG: hypothetical protein ACREGD_04590 [Candidatus Saccharimonadales bacterium]
MEEENSLARRRALVIGLGALFILGIIIFVVILNRGQDAAVDPNKDEFVGLEEGTGDGKTSAVLYNSGDLYAALEENDDILAVVAKDMLLFARTTQLELGDANVLVGFTFSKDFKKDGDTFVYTGYFYGVDDKIEVRLTPHGRGVYTLSVTDLQDGANIDGQLNLNGTRNAYIQTLPIEEGTYSIRYQVPLDRIVVTFYDGYTNEDVDKAVASIAGGLGETGSLGVVYTINRLGVVSIDQVRQNLITPIPLP